MVRKRSQSKRSSRKKRVSRKKKRVSRRRSSRKKRVSRRRSSRKKRVSRRKQRGGDFLSKLKRLGQKPEKTPVVDDVSEDPFPVLPPMDVRQNINPLRKKLYGAERAKKELQSHNTGHAWMMMKLKEYENTLKNYEDAGYPIAKIEKLRKERAAWLASLRREKYPRIES